MAWSEETKMFLKRKLIGRRVVNTTTSEFLDVHTLHFHSRDTTVDLVDTTTGEVYIFTSYGAKILARGKHPYFEAVKPPRSFLKRKQTKKKHEDKKHGQQSAKANEPRHCKQ